MFFKRSEGLDQIFPEKTPNIEGGSDVAAR